MQGAFHRSDVQGTIPGQTNYELSAFEDEAIAQHLASESSAHSRGQDILYRTGNQLNDASSQPLRLCTPRRQTHAPVQNLRKSPSCKGLLRWSPKRIAASPVVVGLVRTTVQSTPGMYNVKDAGWFSTGTTPTRTSPLSEGLRHKAPLFRKTDPTAAILHRITERTHSTDAAVQHRSEHVRGELLQAGVGPATPEAVLEARSAGGSRRRLLRRPRRHVRRQARSRWSWPTPASTPHTTAASRNVPRRRPSAKKNSTGRPSNDKEPCGRSQHQIDDIEKRRKALLELSKSRRTPTTS